MTDRIVLDPKDYPELYAKLREEEAASAPKTTEAMILGQERHAIIEEAIANPGEWFFYSEHSSRNSAKQRGINIRSRYPDITTAIRRLPDTGCGIWVSLNPTTDFELPT